MMERLEAGSPSGTQAPLPYRGASLCRECPGPAEAPIPFSPKVAPEVEGRAIARDNNQHSANENMRLGNYIEGVRGLAGMLTEPFKVP
jgi:hypothetical protein